jgi:hypothetical protein
MNDVNDSKVQKKLKSKKKTREEQADSTTLNRLKEFDRKMRGSADFTLWKTCRAIYGNNINHPIRVVNCPVTEPKMYRAALEKVRKPGEMPSITVRFHGLTDRRC